MINQWHQLASVLVTRLSNHLKTAEGIPRFFDDTLNKETGVSTVIMASKLLSVDFEVFGRVQGVFFRKFTQEQASNLGLRGWCMNTSSGTVKGSMEGDASKIEEMKHWLRFKGSPQSKIEKAEFSNEKEVDKFSYDNFSVRR